MALKIEMGSGWKPDPKKPGRLVTCCPSDYVAEIERLRSSLIGIDDHARRGQNGSALCAFDRLTEIRKVVATILSRA